MTFAFYMFALYPEVFKRLRQEVVSTVGKDGEEWRRPTLEDIKEMKYLRAVINGEYPAPIQAVQHEFNPLDAMSDRFPASKHNASL